MENINKDCVKIKNADIVKFWLENNRSVTAVIDWICGKFQRDADENCMIPIKKKINNFCAYANQKWTTNFRIWAKFEKKESQWLSCETELKLINNDVPIKSGRPKIGYSEGSVRQKRKLASEVSAEQGNDTKLLLHAASIAAHSNKEKDLNFVLKKQLLSQEGPLKLEKSSLYAFPRRSIKFFVRN